MSKEKRPIRLTPATREFALQSLGGRYGREAAINGSVTLDHIEDFEGKSDYEKYDLAIREIAEKAPLRIFDEELLSGAATLGDGIKHVVPASYKGKAVFESVSHLTLGFDEAVKKGVCHYESVIRDRLRKPGLDESQKTLLYSMENTISSLRIWHKRYLDQLKDRKPEHYHNLLRVPFQPPRSFYEAVQSLWLLFSFTRLCGNWSGIGRVDCILGEFLKNDLEQGTITLDRAREILAHFFIKGCEWITGEVSISGDAQHYQNIVLSGIDEEGKDVANEVTALVLEIVEELGISDFPITVRVNEKTPDWLLTKMAQVIRHGGGVVAVYNEPLILESLTDFGYTLRDARRFANDGCWEVQVPGETLLGYAPFDSLQILQNITLRLNSAKPAHFDSFESLYEQYKSDLKDYVDSIQPREPRDFPCSVVSLFTKGCIERGRSYYNFGPNYSVLSPHIGGLPDVVNSLYAIQKVVFEEKRISLDDFLDIIKNDWEGHEELRQYVLNQYAYYGNDSDEVDGIAAKLLDFFADTVLQKKNRGGVLFPPGVSTFGRQIEWIPQRVSTPSGRKKGEILSGNYSPTPGTDKNGATAIIKSYCKADMKKQTCGAALDLKLFPDTVGGERGIETIKSLIRGFVSLGGFFMQIDVIDNEVLKLAQKHPEDYKNLAVRVSGWSARFVTLSQEWQNMIIERTATDK